MIPSSNKPYTWSQFHSVLSSITEAGPKSPDGAALSPLASIRPTTLRITWTVASQIRSWLGCLLPYSVFQNAELRGGLGADEVMVNASGFAQSSTDAY